MKWFRRKNKDKKSDFISEVKIQHNINNKWLQPNDKDIKIENKTQEKITSIILYKFTENDINQIQDAINFKKNELDYIINIVTKFDNMFEKELNKIINTIYKNRELIKNKKNRFNK